MARIAAKRRELVGAPMAHGLRAAPAAAIQHAEAKRKNIRLRLQERFTDRSRHAGFSGDRQRDVSPGW
jgi:hypothetical protein